MIVHKLIDGLNMFYKHRGRNEYHENILGTSTDRFYASIPHYINFLTESIKFEVELDNLGEGGQETIQEIVLAMDKPPYPITCYEVHGQYHTLITLYHEEDNGKRHIASWVTRGKGFTPVPHHITIRPEDILHVKTLGSGDKFELGFHWPIYDLLPDVNLGILEVHIINQILNCQNITTVDIVPSQKLNKKRERQGKIPLFVYKTLAVKKPGINRKYIDNGNPKRKPPRFHTRRGHIRHLPNGNIWIDSMTVGDPSRGTVIKDYRVL